MVNGLNSRNYDYHYTVFSMFAERATVVTMLSFKIDGKLYLQQKQSQTS
jgi:hypothetical protein